MSEYQDDPAAMLQRFADESWAGTVEKARAYLAANPDTPGVIIEPVFKAGDEGFALAPITFYRKDVGL